VQRQLFESSAQGGTLVDELIVIECREIVFVG